MLDFAVGKRTPPVYCGSQNVSASFSNLGFDSFAADRALIAALFGLLQRACV